MLARHIGPAGEQGVEFWYPLHAEEPGWVGGLPEMHRVGDLVPLFITHCETFGREFWPSWN